MSTVYPSRLPLIINREEIVTDDTYPIISHNNQKVCDTTFLNSIEEQIPFVRMQRRVF